MNVSSIVIRLSVGLTVLATSLVMTPQTAQAGSAELLSMTGGDYTNITPNNEVVTENYQTFWLYMEPGTEYTATFAVTDEQVSVDETTIGAEPAVLIVSGGEMANTNLPATNFMYDESTDEVTVTFVPTELLQVGEFENNAPDGQTQVILGLIWPTDGTTGGPDENSVGIAFYTNMQEWSINNSDGDHNGYGFGLNGASGTTGRFTMFLPDASISSLGDDVTSDDVTVYEDGVQTINSITAVEGGGLIDIVTSFTENGTDAELAENNGVSKSFLAAEKDKLSLGSNKYSLRKGGSATLYGWLNRDTNRNKSITIWRKADTDELYKKIDTIKTNRNGYYSSKITVRKSARFKVKYKSDNGRTISSDNIDIMLNN